MTLKKEENTVKNIFKTILNIFKLKKDNKKEIIEKKAIKTKENLKINKKQLKNVQMPAPWSKVEKYKKIKKDSYYNY